MTDNEQMIDLLRAGEKRREERRRFMRGAAGATIAAGGLSLLAACSGDDNGSTATPTPTPTPTPTGSTGVTDADIFNFALNLEYLESQFYVNAVYGQGLPAAALTGTGTQGTVTGGRKVTFTDPVVAQYAREIAADESQHVNFLRSTLGASAISMPSINIDGGATGAFTAAARAAGLVGANETFDPYASDENFLLAAFIFEDVGVTAYKGAAPLITNKTYLEAAAGILAAEAYHAGLLRTALYSKGLQTPSLRTSADKISDARDSLDGSTDLDQGISGDATTSNIVPTDGNGIAFSRTTGQVLNIVYLSKASLASGGFFPNGVNGNIRTSAASG
jgi:hypothetical protein